MLPRYEKAALTLLVELQIQVLVYAQRTVPRQCIHCRKLGEGTDHAKQMAVGTLLCHVRREGSTQRSTNHNYLVWLHSIINQKVNKGEPTAVDLIDNVSGGLVVLQVVRVLKREDVHASCF